MCGILVYVNILDVGCVCLLFFDVLINCAKRCCEFIALMNAVFCFCELVFVLFIVSMSVVVEFMFVVMILKCCFGF